MENADLLKPWQLAREKYKQQKRLVGDREKTTLARLKQFTANLKAASGSNGARKEPPQVCLCMGGLLGLEPHFFCMNIHIRYKIQIIYCFFRS